MKIQHAHQIAEHISKIAEIASTFYARYGSDYRLDDNSPAEAWALYRRFMNEQAEVASLLDTDALDKPFIRYERWWERRDVITSGLVNELAAEALRLIENSAYLTATGGDSNSRSLRNIQEAIAGLLHPATRRHNIDTESTLMQGVG